MLIGNYSNRVSLKGRTAVPAKFRNELGRRVIITQGYEKVLILIAEDVWEKQVALVSARPLIGSPGREADRFMLGNAFSVTLDDQGRFVIPKNLRQFAVIKDKAVFVGIGNRVELWDEKRWLKYQKYLADNVEKLVDKTVKDKNQGQGE